MLTVSQTQRKMFCFGVVKVWQRHLRQSRYLLADLWWLASDNILTLQCGFGKMQNFQKCENNVTILKRWSAERCRQHCEGLFWNLGQGQCLMEIKQDICKSNDKHRWLSVILKWTNFVVVSMKIYHTEESGLFRADRTLFLRSTNGCWVTLSNINAVLVTWMVLGWRTDISRSQQVNLHR